MIKITTLDKYNRISDLIQLLNNPFNSNLFILYVKYRNYKKNHSDQNNRLFYIKDLIRITKINVISKYKLGWLKDGNVDWLQLGPVLQGQYSMLNELQEKGLIRIEKSQYEDEMFRYLFEITKDGIDFIEQKLRMIDIESDHSVKIPFEDDIVNLLKLENEELVNLATEYFGKSNAFEIHNIGEFKIIKIFDWEKFGDGTWNKCYDTLLWSIQSIEKSNRFKKIDANLFDFAHQHIDEFYYFKSKNNETLKSIFQKSLPPYLSEDKIEAKNYIINLWYIVEAVNIYNAIFGFYPDFSDIARMCLLSYKLEDRKSAKRKDFSKLRKLRESILRRDVDKLVDSGILEIAGKFKRKYFYRVSAEKFIDDNNIFILCNPILIRKQYKERKRLYPLANIQTSITNPNPNRRQISI